MDNVKNLLQSIIDTRDQEIACSDCFAVLDQFMDLILQGKDAEDLMPLVQDHLVLCGDCREEFEALLVALQAST
jgi:hypothetical protein